MNTRRDFLVSSPIVEVEMSYPGGVNLCNVTIWPDGNGVGCGVGLCDEARSRPYVEAALDAAGLTYAVDADSGFSLLVELSMTVEQALATIAVAFKEAVLNNPTYKFELIRPDGSTACIEIYIEVMQPIGDRPYSMFCVYDVPCPPGNRTGREQWERYGALLEKCELTERVICGYGGAMFRLTTVAAKDYVAAISQIADMFPR